MSRIDVAWYPRRPNSRAASSRIRSLRAIPAAVGALTAIVPASLPNKHSFGGGGRPGAFLPGRLGPDLDRGGPWMDTYRLVIGGDLVDAASGESFESIDPSTGLPFAHVAKAGKEDVQRAARAARTAFDEGP